MVAPFDPLRVCLIHLQFLPLANDLLTSLSFEVADDIGPKIAKSQLLMNDWFSVSQLL